MNDLAKLGPPEWMEILKESGYVILSPTSELVTHSSHQALLAEIDAVGSEMLQARVNSVPTRERMAESVLNVATIKKRLDALDKEVVKPVNQWKKDWKSIYNALKNKLAKFDEHGNKEIQRFNQELEKRERKKREADEEKLRKEAEGYAKLGAECEAENAPPPPPPKPSVDTSRVKTESGRMLSYKDKWKARVVDVDKLDRKYMIPDQQMLDKIAQATKGEIPLDGVEFDCEKVPLRRT